MPPNARRGAPKILAVTAAPLVIGLFANCSLIRLPKDILPDIPLFFISVRSAFERVTALISSSCLSMNKSNCDVKE